MIDTEISIATRHCRGKERQKNHDRRSIERVQEVAEGKRT